MSVRIDGKKIALEMKESMKNYLTKNPTHIIFDIIYVGSDPVIDNFITYKKKFGKDLGIKVIVHNFSENISQKELVENITRISSRAQAVIVQLPLPKHIQTQLILDLIPPEKDVDVLASLTKGYFKNTRTPFYPAVTGAIIKCMEYYDINLDNKNIVVVGNGSLVGRPVCDWLTRQGYHYDLITKESSKLKKGELLSKGDVIISGVGQPHMITLEDISQGVVLIDAGTSEADLRVLGDVHPGCTEKAAYMTPVPGGIGPITIAILYENVLRAYNCYDR
jgi:methylenetetrahydrofolate dehydrogenase (NADP+)/methenyltetrahydrofolate cyclohydrolase